MSKEGYKKNRGRMFPSPLAYTNWYHYNNVIWASWCLKSSATSLFAHQLTQVNDKGNIKGLYYLLPLCPPPKWSFMQKTFPCHDDGSDGASCESLNRPRGISHHDNSDTANYIHKGHVHCRMQWEISLTASYWTASRSPPCSVLMADIRAEHQRSLKSNLVSQWSKEPIMYFRLSVRR